MPNARTALGRLGEQAACDFLALKGYAIVTTNWRCPEGEVDIVARDGDTLVFVEVRTRTGKTTEYAWRSLSPKKQAAMSAVAYAYLSAHTLDTPWRVDAIAISRSASGRLTIEHAENVLDW